MMPIDEIILRTALGGGTFVEVRITRGADLTAKKLEVLGRQIALMHEWFQDDEKALAGAMVAWGEAIRGRAMVNESAAETKE